MLWARDYTWWCKSQIVPKIQKIVCQCTIIINSTLFLNRISRWPSSSEGVIPAVAVVVEAADVVAGFGAEAVLQAGAGVSCKAGQGAEGVVFVVGKCGSCGGEVFADVAIAIVGGEVIGVAAADPTGGKKSANSPRSLHAATKVESPEKGIMKDE